MKGIVAAKVGFKRIYVRGCQSLERMQKFKVCVECVKEEIKIYFGHIEFKKTVIHSTWRFQKKI